MSIRYQLVKNISQAYILNHLLNITFPPFDKKTKNLKVQEPMLGIVARDDEEIIGAVIFEAVSKSRNPEVLSFFVKKEYRSKGIGSELFRLANKAIEKAHIKDPLIFFRSNWKENDKLVHLLKKHSWNTPVSMVNVYKSNIREFNKVKWPVNTTLQSPYNIIPYADANEDIRNAVEQAFKKKLIPAFLHPFHNEHAIETAVSSFLTFNNQLAGWLIGYRNTPVSVEYNNLFLFPAYRKKITLPMIMLHHAISKQLEANIFEGIWIIQSSNRKMIAYIERYFGTAILQKEQIFKSVKK